MSEKLRNCPFCGNHVEMVNTKTYPNFERSPAYMKCRTCNYHIAAFDDENLINRWNDRPIEDELRAELEKRTAELHYANTACMEMKHELARRDEELALTEKKLCNIDRSARTEVARRDEKLKITDGLLKEATETIGAVIACCTYNSNDDAKIGIYGIDQKAFTRIDQFITHYNDAVSAGKVSVDVKRELSDAEINELGAQEAEKRGEK